MCERECVWGGGGTVGVCVLDRERNSVFANSLQ